MKLGNRGSGANETGKGKEERKLVGSGKIKKRRVGKEGREG